MNHGTTALFFDRDRLLILSLIPRWATVLTLFAAMLPDSGTPLYGQATFTPLGTFGGARSEATDVSADGSVVVGLTDSAVFRWTATETALRPGDYLDWSPAVSANGMVVVGRFASTSGPQAFRWNTSGTFEPLGDLPGGAFSSGSSDVSMDGQIVVGVSASANDDEAFRWAVDTGIVGLGGLPGHPIRSSASGISLDGSVIAGAGWDGDNRVHPVRWTEQTGMVALPLLPGATNGSASAISPDALVIIGTNVFPPQPGSLQPSTEAFRWSENDGVRAIGNLPGGRMIQPLDVSADGSVIVGHGETLRQDGVPITAAFYWTAATGTVNLRQFLISAGVTNLDGWSLIEAHGVSYDGLTVVGRGIHNGRSEAWIATIPEPSTLLLGAIAGVAAVVMALRRYSALSQPRPRGEWSFAILCRPLTRA